jgi:uncharacterized protein YukE
MSIRNLGDWSPLGLDAEPIHADPDMVRDAQSRYQKISTAVGDAVTRLGKIVDGGSEGLAGQYVEGLHDQASQLQVQLKKVATRYEDVAAQIKLYEPDLDESLQETGHALEDARLAHDAQTKAHSMPDPRPDADGATSPEEQQKQTDKNKAVATADGDLATAKSRLTRAMDQLNTAGKRFGDAVNCEKYDDGLTDTYKDKLDAVMAKISQIFAIIGMVLGVLAIFIPGVDLLVLGGVVAGAITLVANVVLYADGEGSVLDVVLGAVGLGLAGLGGLATLIGKASAASARAAANLRNVGTDVAPGGALAGGRPVLEFRPGALGQDIALRPMGAGAAGEGAGAAGAAPAGPAILAIEWNAADNVATRWQNMSDWFNNPVTNGGLRWLDGRTPAGFPVITPEIGFWPSAFNQFQDAGKLWGTVLSDPAKFGKDWLGVVGGWSGFKDLSAIMQTVGGSMNPLWYVWGAGNGAFGLGGLIYTGGRLQGWIPRSTRDGSENDAGPVEPDDPAVALGVGAPPD